jgi:hypothetical protein
MSQPGYPPYGSPYGPPPGGGGYGPPGGGGYGPPPGGGYGGPGGPSYPSIPPGPPAKGKSPLPLIIGGVLALVLIVGAGAGAFMFMKGRGKSPGLPVDPSLLPSSTKEVGTQLIEATREPNETVRRTYLASELGGSLCRQGFGNPAHTIEGIGKSSARSAKELFFDKKRLEDMQQVLECGALIADKLDSPYAGFISFEDDQSKRRDALVLHMKLTDIPSKFGYTKQNFGKMKGFCRTQAEDFGLKLGDAAPDKGGECKDTSRGAFPTDATWFLGDKQSLDLLAKTVATPREELSASVTALKDAAAQTDGLPVVRLSGNPKSSREFFSAPCSWAASQSGASFTEFTDGCFPAKAQEKTLTEIDSKIRAAAYELDSDYAKAGAMVGNIIFVARDADAAKSLEADVKELVSEWKAHLETNDAKLINSTKDKAFRHTQKKFAAVVDTFFAALHKMKVTRSGRTIRISYNEKLSKDDLTELEDADKSTVEKRIATAQILDAIQSKKPIPQGSLGKLVGPKWAAYLLGPPPADLAGAKKEFLTESECKAAQRQLSPVKFSEMSSQQAKDLYFQIKLSPCSGLRTPEVLPIQRACLAKFHNANDFMLCAPLPQTPSNEPPESDFGEPKK